MSWSKRINCTLPMIFTTSGNRTMNRCLDTLQDSVTSILGARKLMIGQPTTPSRMAYDPLIFGIWCIIAIWHTYYELMKKMAIHAKVEYFNSKDGPTVRQEEPVREISSVKNHPFGKQKRKNDSSHQQGSSKKSKAQNHGDQPYQWPPPNQALEVFTLLNTSYEEVLMNEQ